MLQLHGLRLLNEGINFLQNKQMAALTSLLADLLDGLDSKHEVGQQKPLQFLRLLNNFNRFIHKI